MRTLVTGGAGFIGSHLVDRLLSEGREVEVVDSLRTGSIRNLAHLRGRPDVQLIVADVRDRANVEWRSPDEIWNLACPAAPNHYQADPIATTTTSVFGVVNVLELAERRACPVLHASTSEVYGDPDVHPQPESYWGRVNPVGPRSCYDEGKRCAESLCFDYRRQRGVEVRVVRIFNTYGPRMQSDDGRVVSNFIVQALRGEPLTIYGDGSQTRSFCYVGDTVEALVRLMGGGHPGPVNVGNQQEVSVAELASLIARLAGSRSTVEFRPLPEDDPRQRRPDTTLVEKLTGWTPRVSLEEGLERTIHYFRRAT
jgi:UDP-glucuronate decarboxylase